MATESTVFGRSDLFLLSRFLKTHIFIFILDNPYRYLFSHLVTVLESTLPLAQQMFLVAYIRYGPVQTYKEVPELDYVTRSSEQLPNQRRSKAVQNVSAHYLPQYYQLQRVSSLSSLLLLRDITRCERVRTNMKQNFWLDFVYIYIVNYALRPTLKKALCCTRPVVGTYKQIPILNWFLCFNSISASADYFMVKLSTP